MVQMTVSVDMRDLKQALAALGAKAPRAIMRAVNRTARSARTQAVRAVAKEVRLPQKDIRPMLPVISATVQQYATAKLIAQGRPLSLMRLGARQTKLGVIYRGPGGPVLIRSAFIKQMPKSKRPTVWLRSPLPSERKSAGAWSKNLPIARQVGPSVPKLVIEKGIFDAVRRTATETLRKNLTHEVDYLLSRQGASRG